MAGKRLSVSLTLNDKQFQSGLRKATKSMAKFGKSMQRTGKTLSKSLTLPIAALNLATRLDGDLKSASIQLGKALNDPVANLSALSRAGIQFSVEQKETIKSLAETNRLAEAQNIILQELETQFGGAAEAAAKAGLGPFEQLRNALSDVSEEFGKLILENIEPLKKSIIELTGFLRGLNTAQKQLALKIAGITAVAGPLLIILGKVAKAVSTLVKLFMKLTPKGRILSLILTGLTLVFKPLKKAFESLTKTGKEFKNMVSTTGDVMETSPLFDTKNYAKVEKEVKKVTKSFAKFREVASISPIAAGPVSPTGGQTSPAPQFATDGSFMEQMQNNFEIMFNINELTEQMTSNFQSFGGAIEQAFATALVSQGDFFKVFIDNAKRALAQIAAQIAAMAVLNALLGATSLGGLLGFKDIGGFAGIPKLFGNLLGKGVSKNANGGLIQQPHFGLIGEAGPEVVMPLDRFMNTIGGGGAVEVFGTISGSDILLSSDRARGNRNRTRGY